MNGTDTMADRGAHPGWWKAASPASERLGDEQIDGREQRPGDVMLVDRDD